MCLCAPAWPQTGGPGTAQTTPMTHIRANRAPRQAALAGLVAAEHPGGRPELGVVEQGAHSGHHLPDVDGVIGHLLVESDFHGPGLRA